MDPYAILGVSKNCDRDTLKKKYKQLALASHPDRGGSEALFKIIKLSYHKINEELKLRQIDKQFNELKTEFSENKRKHEKPRKNKFLSDHDSVSKAESSSDFITHFNKVFDETKLETPQDSGYSHLMDASTSRRDDMKIENTLGKFNKDNFNKSFDQIPMKNTKQLMKYKEPVPTSITKNLDFVELGIDHIDDFSGRNECSSQSLRFMDYQNAHTTNRLVDPSQMHHRSDCNNLQQLEMERTNIDFQMTEQERMAYLKHQKKNELREQRRVENLQRQDLHITENFNRIHNIMIERRR